MTKFVYQDVKSKYSVHLSIEIGFTQSRLKKNMKYPDVNFKV